MIYHIIKYNAISSTELVKLYSKSGSFGLDVLFETEPSLEQDQTFINTEFFPWIKCLRTPSSDHIRHLSDIVQLIPVWISWIMISVVCKMKESQDQKESISSHQLAEYWCGNHSIFSPIHRNSWLVNYSHQNKHCKKSKHFFPVSWSPFFH